MRIKIWALAAPLLVLFSGDVSVALAQETLAGVGAASGIGATLGATATGGGLRARQGAGNAGAPGQMDETMMDGGANPQFPGSVTTTTQTTVTRTITPLAGPRGTGEGILGQLLAPPMRRATPERPRRSARAQAAYSRRVARLSPTARKKLVLNKYRIAPRGYLASYLSADRYKFAKAWKYVSTETDRFYYRPQDMARLRGFNANRVIGFRTWQDAMLAGYRPDPVSKPEPGRDLAYLATLTRDEPLTQYVEYIYSGQVSPISVTNTVRYVRRVKSVIDRNPSARKYQRETVNSILMASLTGDASLIPRQLGYVAPVAPAGIGGANPEFPTARINNAPQGAGALSSSGMSQSSGNPPGGFSPPPAEFRGPPRGSAGPPAGFAGPPSGFAGPRG